nr:LuxR C-terminal-related transcriptional regulator [Nocardia jinanensis]
MSGGEMDPAISEAIEVIVGTARRLSTSPRSATHGVLGVESALEALTAMERALTSRETAGIGRAARSTIRSARAQLLSVRLAGKRSKVELITAQIARLRAARSLEDLLESLPSEVSALGYERVLFSWVENERWVPRSAYVMGRPQESQAMLTAGGPPYQPVRELLEVDVVRKRRPILVLDADTNPRVHPTIYPVTRSLTYVAAPVVAHDRVAGIVHVDRSIETGLNDEFDRDLLALFCQSVGIAVDRLLDAPSSTDTDTPSAITQHWPAALTQREREVLRLMAAGFTNAQIGARLYISEETAKTHAKRLMRKMGVSNRAQAGAMYHRLRAS